MKTMSEQSSELNSKQQARRDREERATRWAAASFFVAILGSLSLMAVYLSGGQTQLEGLSLFVAFGGVGVGLGIWVRVIIDEPHVIEPRHAPGQEPAAARAAFGDEFESAMGDAAPGGSRRFLLKMLAGVGASLGLALLVPLRSLGPGPASELFTTPWTGGQRLVTNEGEEVRASDIGVDQVVTVFPADAVGSADGQAVLIGLRPEREDLNRAPHPDGLACFSKICTHAGCPVGLYRASVGELLCPCHQSTFDVYDNAEPLSGPTGRPLPSLPFGIDSEGFLVAMSDFTAPVGPSFWNLNDRPNLGEEAGT
jgi:ubiquinol-cytochrome c reductase iron-sulfur subunit